MIDANTEALKTLKDAAAHPILKRSGKRPAKITLMRWATRGTTIRRNGTSRKVILETLRVGGCLHTTDAAIERFVAALNTDHSDQQPAKRTPTRERMVEHAERELAGMGIL